MKNRFYDAKMHGADWNAAKATYGALLDYLADDEELHNVMMHDDRRAERVAHRRERRAGAPGDAPAPQTRYPGLRTRGRRVGLLPGRSTSGRAGPADNDYVKLKKGDFILAVNDQELKTTDNYWQLFTMAAGRKFHFLVNGKPVEDGAWEVAIEPMSRRRAHRRAVRRMGRGPPRHGRQAQRTARSATCTSGPWTPPSLRQFTLDLAMNRTKKALVIDQRFNGGGGIDQELLEPSVGQKYQYSRGRDAGLDVPRPLETFYGPMVVMQNERSASDAEMFPQGFKDLKLGKVIGVPTMGAVIGTGSFTLADGSTIRTPGSGVWTAAGENMENFGVKPDVYVDNAPEDFLKGRDAQIEKAVEVLKAESPPGGEEVGKK